MRHPPTACRVCAGSALWRVSPMVELGFLDEVELAGAVDGLAPLAPREPDGGGGSGGPYR